MGAARHTEISEKKNIRLFMPFTPFEDRGLRIAVRHRDTETQSRKRKEAFSTMSFSLFLYVCGASVANRNPQSAIPDLLQVVLR
jgi:hypothetical protein